MRTERLLASAQLDVGSLSPAAILVVRTLRDPLPGQWRLTPINRGVCASAVAAGGDDRPGAGRTERGSAD